MRLKIVQAGDPVLREVARALTSEEIASDETQRLIRDMQETMYDAPGVGLAAPQVGMALLIAVIEDREEYLKMLPAQELAEKERRPVPFHVLINPKIVEMHGEEKEFCEGCLSLPGFSAVVRRARTVRVDHLNERGEPRHVEATGWTPGFCNTRSITWAARCISIACAAARLRRWTTGTASGRTSQPQRTKLIKICSYCS